MAAVKPQVALLMGSDSDYPKLESAIDILTEFGVRHEVRVMSAHRTPDLVVKYVTQAERQGLRVFICAAGGAAHLAGVVAGHTTLPVIGIPVPIEPLNGLDSLLATVQMPAGVPVATVAAGSGGPPNAALLSVQILALSDKVLARKLKAYKRKMVAAVTAKNDRLQKKLSS